MAKIDKQGIVEMLDEELDIITKLPSNLVYGNKIRYESMLKMLRLCGHDAVVKDGKHIVVG